MNVLTLSPEDCVALVAKLRPMQRMVLVTCLRTNTSEEAHLELNVCRQTVSHHLGVVYDKFGVNRLHQAAVIATKAGLL